MTRFPARLTLTSPPRQGKTVKQAQAVLNGKNRLKKDFLKSDVDGVFGPLTQQAVKNAQYWLGFPKRNINGVYGPTIHSLLLPAGTPGAAALPASYKVRRRARLRKAKLLAARAARRVEMARIARTQVGTVESPAGSNKVKYSDWYGMRGPWCAMFVSWCADRAGIKFRYAYCPYIEADAKAGRNRLRLVGRQAVRKGDIALFHFGGGEAKHVGIVESIDIGAGTVTCIEGNTSKSSGGSQDNGGGVFVRTRPLTHVRHFVRVDPS